MAGGHTACLGRLPPKPLSLLCFAGNSCQPATRAAGQPTTGDEVTISYVGPEQLRPLAARRVALKAAFDFLCCCPRCVGEAGLPDSVQATIDAVAAATAEVRPAFEAAVRSRDAAALRDARLEAAAALVQLYGELRRCLVRPAARLWVQAGLYDTLEVGRASEWVG